MSRPAPQERLRFGMDAVCKGCRQPFSNHRFLDDRCPNEGNRGFSPDGTFELLPPEPPVELA